MNHHRIPEGVEAMSTGSIIISVIAIVIVAAIALNVSKNSKKK